MCRFYKINLIAAKPRAKQRVGKEIGKEAAEKSKGLFAAEDWVCSKFVSLIFCLLVLVYARFKNFRYFIFFTRGEKYKIQPSHCSTMIRYNSFFIRTARIYSRIPTQIKNTLQVFSKLIAQIDILSIAASK